MLRHARVHVEDSGAVRLLLEFKSGLGIQDGVFELRAFGRWF